MAARAWGLSTHLLGAERSIAVERTGDVAGLLRELKGTPYERWLPSHESGATAIETAVTRSVADRLATLARWGAADVRALGAVFVEQDARNIRAIVRGIVGGLTPERRVADAVPTPLLDRRALEALSRVEVPGAVAAMLTAWGHPLGSALLDEASRTHPDLHRLEAALARRLAEVALTSAKRAGRRVEDFVREGIDADNVVTALLLSGTAREGPARDAFLPGGVRLGLDDFWRAADAPDRALAAQVLVRATRGTPFALALREPPWSPAAVAGRLLSSRVDRLAAERRLEPLSAVPVLLFVLRLRGEASELRRALWRASLTGGRRV